MLILIITSVLLTSSLTAIGAEKTTKLAKADIYPWTITKVRTGIPTSIFVDGIWRADILNEDTELALDATTHLECYVTGGKELANTDGYCMEAVGTSTYGMPDVEVNYFGVTKWNKEQIIASSSPSAPFPICTWTQPTINLSDGN